MAWMAALGWEMQAAQVLGFLGIQAALEWMAAPDVEFQGVQALAKLVAQVLEFLGRSGMGNAGSSGFGISGNSGFGMDGNSGCGISGSSGFGKVGSSGFGISGISGLGNIVGISGKGSSGKVPEAYFSGESSSKYPSSNLARPMKIHPVIYFHSQTPRDKGMMQIQFGILSTSDPIHPSLDRTVFWRRMAYYHVNPSFLLLFFITLSPAVINMVQTEARNLLEITLPELPFPQIPTLPKPEIPTLPEIPKPELPKPELPEIPHPELPSIPKLPEFPEIPKPELPAFPIPSKP
nr:protein PELPK1 [Ipomoea batatas]